MSEKERFPSRAQVKLILLILALGSAGVAYRILVGGRLEQTAALFIGIPLILAILLALTPRPSTATGSILKGITLGLLLSGPLLGEGFICILMAAPLFWIVGLFVGLLIDLHRRKKKAATPLLLILIPMSAEGTAPWLSFNREETVRATLVVSGSAAAVEGALSRSPRTDVPLPGYLRLGFPHPSGADGGGLGVGATRVIHFAGGEGRPGDLLLRVEEAHPGFVCFRAITDHSKIAHWLDWNSSEVQWTQIDAGHTRVNWTIHYQRRLDPAWYFGPWERYAVHLAAEHLIRANATPASAPEVN